jgi:hypothetical protein
MYLVCFDGKLPASIFAVKIKNRFKFTIFRMKMRPVVLLRIFEVHSYDDSKESRDNRHKLFFPNVNRRTFSSSITAGGHLRFCRFLYPASHKLRQRIRQYNPIHSILYHFMPTPGNEPRERLLCPAYIPEEAAGEFL